MIHENVFGAGEIAAIFLAADLPVRAVPLVAGLLEIFFRVKDVQATLFRCATACKRWGQLVAEPAFLRRCWPDQDVSSCFVGLFTRQQNNLWLSHAPYFTPTPRSALIPRRRTFGTFMPAAPAGVFDDALPLVSRHGLLLVRLDTIATRGYPNPVILDLAVCNLLTGTCHMLPTHKFGAAVDEHGRWNGYAILTGADYRPDDEPVLPSTSLFFNVVIISSCNRHGMNSSLHTFSSDQGTWKVRTNCFDGIVQPISYESSCRAVVRRGTAHWLFCYYGELCLGVLNLNIRTGHISFTKLPFRIHLKCHPSLTLAVNGALSLLWMQETGTQLEIWEKQLEQPNKDGGLQWVCRKTIDIKQLEKRENKGGDLRVLAEKSGTLLVHDTINGAYTADLETGIIEEAVNCPRSAPREIVPLEVDWPAIFASRFDARKQKMENQVTYPPGWELMYLLGKERRKA